MSASPVRTQVSKLVNPVETEHKDIGRGLADALFGQGKIQKGKQVMAQCGLANFEAGGRAPMPASYIRLGCFRGWGMR